jgi:hypothetical protein
VWTTHWRQGQRDAVQNRRFSRAIITDEYGESRMQVDLQLLKATVICQCDVLQMLDGLPFC